MPQLHNDLKTSCFPNSRGENLQTCIAMNFKCQKLSISIRAKTSYLLKALQERFLSEYFFAVPYHLLYVQHRIIIVIWSQVTQKKNNQMEATLNWTLLFLWINDIWILSYSKQERKRQPTCKDKPNLVGQSSRLLSRAPNLSTDIHIEVAKILASLDQVDMLQIYSV